MDQRISIITLGVSDLKKSRDFYDSLGWSVASNEDTEDIICYNLNGMSFALFPRDGLAEDAGVEIKSEGYSSITLAYNVSSENEVDEVLSLAKEAGAEIVKQGQAVFWGGYSGYFADPDKNLWEVACNPFSPLKKDGSFQRSS